MGTKRATWDNDRDGLLIELLLVGLQQGKKSDSGFKIMVFNDAAKQFYIRFNVTPKFKGSQLQTSYYTVSILLHFLTLIVVTQAVQNFFGNYRIEWIRMGQCRKDFYRS